MRMSTEHFFKTASARALWSQTSSYVESKTSGAPGYR